MAKTRKEIAEENEHVWTEGIINGELKNAIRRVQHLEGAIILAFLRGYQSGFEDCKMGVECKHYAREIEDMEHEYREAGDERD